MDNILTVAINAVKRIPMGNFSERETSDTIRNAFIELNGGSTKINYKKFYRGSAMFSLVEDLIPVMIDEGLKNNNPIFNLVEYKNISNGDVNEFYTKGKALFVVSEVAGGVQGIRRQLIGDGERASVKTTMKAIRVYDDLERFLAGRVDFNELVNGVAESFNRKMLEDAYAAIAGVSTTTAGLDSNHVIAGTFDEDALLALIERIEAETGKDATIYGTKTALRLVTTAEVADEAKSDKYNIGYYGKFNGTDMVRLRQGIKLGGNGFVLNDAHLYIIAGDDRPIKLVNEGTGIIAEKDIGDNNDLTQEYFYGQAYGVGVLCGEKIGVAKYS